MNNIWDILGHKKICDTVTAEWLSETVCLLRFLFPEPGELPYRGVVNAHVTGPGAYEFKGMCFLTGEAPTKVEHTKIKTYFVTERGLVGRSKRLKKGIVVTHEYD